MKKNRVRNIERVLERWGGWAARDSSQLDWSPVAAGFKKLVCAPCSHRPGCSDNDGLIVDSCVIRLRSPNRHAGYDLLIAHYVYGVSKRSLAKYLKRDEKTVRVELQIAEGFVEGCLCMLDIQLEMDPEVEAASAPADPERERIKTL